MSIAKRFIRWLQQRYLVKLEHYASRAAQGLVLREQTTGEREANKHGMAWTT